MKQLFSRYGGHGIILNPKGATKSSALNIPEDQSFENIMAHHAIEMNGYAYLSSYQMMPEFMGRFDNLPVGYCTKLGVLEHLFMEVFLQYDVTVDTAVYWGKTKYSNVFSLFIKTDYSPLLYALGKIESNYDLVLFISILDKTNEEIESELMKIVNLMICLLIKEMDLADTEIVFKPSKTHLGKRMDMDGLMNSLNTLKNGQNINLC